MIEFRALAFIGVTDDAGFCVYSFVVILQQVNQGFLGTDRCHAAVVLFTEAEGEISASFSFIK